MKQALDKHKYGHKGVSSAYLHTLGMAKPKIIRSDYERKRQPLYNKNQREITFTIPDVPNGDEYILFTGGVGDVLALESFFSDEKKSKIKCIYYATRSAQTLIEIFSSLHAYKTCTHEVLWSDFSQFFCYYNKAGVLQNMQRSNKVIPPNWSIIQDWSIGVRFPQVGSLTHYGPSVLKQTLCESKHVFPKPYYTLVPYSPNDERDPRRKINQSEWVDIVKFLEKKDCLGVVVNSGTQQAPKHQRIIDLTGQTSMVASIEILKKGIGYIGVDSSLSVLASKLFTSENLRIKSNNSHLYDHKRIYYAPNTKFDFLSHKISL